MRHTTREGWLTAAIDELREHFRTLRLVVPAKVRVSCGWPRRAGCDGEYWPAALSAGRFVEIFISPMHTIPITSDGSGILATLTHEVVHAVVGVACGHRGRFRKVACRIGLCGPLTSSYAGKELIVVLKEIAEDLGPYPHDLLTPPPARKKRKSTGGLRKVQCPGCGYIARVSRMWLNSDGPPLCPTCRLAFREETD